MTTERPNEENAVAVAYGADGNTIAEAMLHDGIMHFTVVVLQRPKRVQMSRQRPWRAEHPDAVIVARPSKWGNPYRVGGTAMVESDWHGDRVTIEYEMTPALAIELYRQRFIHDSREIRAELAGRDLACWCPLDKPCHADVLLEIANA